MLKWSWVPLILFACDLSQNQRDAHFAQRETEIRQQADERNRRIAEQRAKDDKERHDHEERAWSERRQEEQEQTDRKRAAEDAVRAKVQTHHDECAHSFPQRFDRWKRGLDDMVKLKKVVPGKCKALAQHCTTITGGTSACRGLTQQEQGMFDTICASWPNYHIVETDDEACNDVDPWQLTLDAMWSNEKYDELRKTPKPQP